jgi:hypothetical protein
MGEREREMMTACIEVYKNCVVSDRSTLISLSFLRRTFFFIWPWFTSEEEKGSETCKRK